MGGLAHLPLLRSGFYATNVTPVSLFCQTLFPPLTEMAFEKN